MALDVERTDQAYLLGRLFAVLERIQQNGLGEKLNRTIKDSFYSGASATPAAVFPRLLKLKNHHIDKIDSPGQRIMREKEVGSIMNQLVDFPPTLSVQGQGLFAIGYYHQRQSYFQKSSADSTVSE